MGCDIHLFCEKRVNGEWQVIEDVPCPWCDGTGTTFDKECFSCYGKKRSYYPNDETGRNDPWAFCYRNYQLFSILADVRNYHKVPSLFAERDVPEDVSERGRVLANSYDEDGHSHTHFTMVELTAGLAAMAPIPNGGLVDAKGFLQWKEDGRPKSWCGGVSGPRIQIVDHVRMEKEIVQHGLITARNLQEYGRGGLHNFYTEVSWADAPADIARHLVATLERIRAEQGIAPEDLRAIAFFDN